MIILTGIPKPKEDVDLARSVIKLGAMGIRDIERGQSPYPYTSGAKGPGYIGLDGLIGDRPVFFDFVTAADALLRAQVDQAGEYPHMFFGIATGAIAFGLAAREVFFNTSGFEVPFGIVKTKSKPSPELGLKDVLTGFEVAQLILPERPTVVLVEELINFGSTVAKARTLLMELAASRVEWIVTMLDYQNPKSNQILNDTPRIAPLTLSTLLGVAEMDKAFDQRLIDDFRFFLVDPGAWNKKWGLN